MHIYMGCQNLQGAREKERPLRQKEATNPKFSWTEMKCRSCVTIPNWVSVIVVMVLRKRGLNDIWQERKI